MIHNAQSHHTDYSGAFQYEDGFLTLILTPEGRIVKHSSTYDPQYFLKDYLGNVRVVYHANPETGMVEVVQEDHYDPFGMKLGGLGYVSDIENKYLFQGKELNDEAIDTDSDGNTDTYMNWYDFEARQFDPQIARWHVADPVAQYPSPYVGMGNNPVSLVDPNGMATIWSLEESYYYRAYYSDFTGHGGHFGSEREIYTRSDPSMADEMQSLMEQGQMSADGVYGGGSNYIANTIYGDSQFSAREAQVSEGIKKIINQIIEFIKDQDVSWATAPPPLRMFVEEWKLKATNHAFLINATEEVFCGVMQELCEDINGNVWQERMGYNLDNSNSYLILPSYKSKIVRGTYSSSNDYHHIAKTYEGKQNNLRVRYKDLDYRVTGVYHVHPYRSSPTRNSDFMGKSDAIWMSVRHYIIFNGTAYRYTYP